MREVSYKSYDEALVKLCRGSNLIGMGPTLMVLMQNMTREKQQEILAISRGEKNNATISAKEAACIVSKIENYNVTLKFYQENIGCFSQLNNNNQQ
jgi:hypothetical protein